MHTWLYHAIKEVDVDFQVVPNGSWTLPLAVMLQACLPIQPRDTSLPNLINFFGGNHLMLQQVCSLRLLRAKSSRRPSSSMGFGGSYRLSPLWHWFRMPNTPIFKSGSCILSVTWAHCKLCEESRPVDCQTMSSSDLQWEEFHAPPNKDTSRFYNSNVWCELGRGCEILCGFTSMQTSGFKFPLDTSFHCLLNTN